MSFEAAVTRLSRFADDDVVGDCWEFGSQKWQHVVMDTRRAWLAVSLVDLTNLNDECTNDDVDTLCARAIVAGTAAVCVWPDFVARAAATLDGHPPAVATVVNFPTGDERTFATSLIVDRALEDGADEIDVVLPYRSFIAGERVRSGLLLAAVRAATEGSAVMKVILETGELADESMIAAASEFAIDHGADFLKTSTGRSPVSATPEAVAAMLGKIEHAGRPVGLKVSGGLRTAADAETYLSLAESVMGESYLDRSTFRLGASSLLDALLGVEDAAGLAKDDRSDLPDPVSPVDGSGDQPVDRSPGQPVDQSFDG